MGYLWALTYDPFYLLTMRGCIPWQITVHLEETFTSIQHIVVRLQTFTNSTIDREFRDRKLKTPMLGPGGI